MATLKGKTVFITGSSRGIGKAIGLAAARDGANVVITGKSEVPNPKLPGTIQSRPRRSSAPEARRSRSSSTSGTRSRSSAAVARGRGAVRRHRRAREQRERHLPRRHRRHAGEALRPHAPGERPRHLPRLAGLPAPPRQGEEPAHPEPLAAARHAREVVRAPRRLHHGEVRHEHVRAGDGRGARVAGHRRERALAAHRHRHRGAEPPRRARRSPAARASPDIVADAARFILLRDSRSCTGNFFIDDEVLRSEGVTDLSRYARVPSSELAPDLFLDP